MDAGSTDWQQRPASAIVIPTLNGRPGVERCLDSLAWAPRVGAHIIIVDAGSTDGTVELAVARTGVRVLSAGSDKWWAGSTNIGCEWALTHLHPDVLCLLNHDCTWDEQSYLNLLAEASRHPGDIHCSKVVSLSPPRILFAGGTVRWTGLLGMPGFGRDASRPSPSGEVAWCGGMGVMFGTHLWLTLAGLDEEAFPHYYADSDFCFRARRSGAHVRLCADSVVVNDTSTSGFRIPNRQASLHDVLESLTSRRSPQNLPDALRFFRRHLGLRAPLALGHLYARHVTMGLVRMTRG